MFLLTKSLEASLSATNIELLILIRHAIHYTANEIMPDQLVNETHEYGEHVNKLK